ncbi:hypothetical protein PCI56_10020 [Plesiomonas shigelloides subsp. oncorhynchi]|nr:hypothetical protein [Plesiomonas shigelloides]
MSHGIRKSVTPSAALLRVIAGYLRLLLRSFAGRRFRCGRRGGRFTDLV